MLKLLLGFIIFVAYFGSSRPLESTPYAQQELYSDELTSRFILNSDIKIDNVVDIPIRASWWSRPHEYAWASQFADKDAVVLDAACGISHPFKWYLGETCKSAWACDADPRIDNIETIIQETYDDLGEVAYSILVNTPRLHQQVTLVKASICQLPANMPQFDRIFCISTLEHLCKKDQTDAMTEFARFLAPDGLLILTVDYPEVTPKALLALADSVGLAPASDYLLNRPQGALTNGYLSIFRCVFVHKPKNG